MRRVVVTGLGLVTPLGADVETTWSNLIAGKSGAGMITHFDASDQKCLIACEVKPKDHPWGFDPDKRVDHKVQRQVDPFIIYGIDAAGQAIEDAGLTDMDEATRLRAITKLDPLFPAENFPLNWVLCETLVALQSPTIAAKGIAALKNAPGQEEQMEYARSLRMLKAGWTPALREAQLNWFVKAASYRGGSSFGKFVEFIRNDSLATFSPEELARHEKLIALAKNPPVKSAYENVGAMFAGRTPRNWTLDELSAATKTGLKGRDFDQGKKVFSAAACFTCHRFGNAGGMTGPDLTLSGGRYSPHDFLDQIINPSKVINEQFAPVIVTKNNGETFSGVVVNLNGDRVSINTDLSDPSQQVSIDRKEVKSIELSTLSPMPPMLLSMLTQEEILDLVAYVLSGGDKDNAWFKK